MAMAMAKVMVITAKVGTSSRRVEARPVEVSLEAEKGKVPVSSATIAGAKAISPHTVRIQRCAASAEAHRILWPIAHKKAKEKAKQEDGVQTVSFQGRAKAVMTTLVGWINPCSLTAWR